MPRRSLPLSDASSNASSFSDCDRVVLRSSVDSRLSGLRPPIPFLHHSQTTQHASSVSPSHAIGPPRRPTPRSSSRLRAYQGRERENDAYARQPRPRSSARRVVCERIEQREGGCRAIPGVCASVGAVEGASDLAKTIQRPAAFAPDPHLVSMSSVADAFLFLN